MTSPSQSPSRARTVWLPALLLLIAMFNLTLPVAALKEWVVDGLGGSVTDAALFLSVEMVAYMICAPLWGLLSDRNAHRKRWIVGGFLASGVLYLLYPHVHSVAELLALRFVQGAFAVMGWSTLMALVADHADDQRRGRAMGAVGGALILGIGMGAPIGGAIAKHLGPVVPLELAGILFLAIGALALALPEPALVRSRASLRQIAGTLRERPRLLVPCLFYFADRLTIGLFLIAFPLYLHSLGSDDPAMRGRYLGMFLLPFALLQPLAGRLIERFGAYRPLVAGSLFYGIALCAVGYTGKTGLAGLMLLLGAVAAVMFPPTLALVGELADPRARGSAMGGFNLAGSLGFAIGPLVGAWAQAAGGFRFTFVLSGSLAVALALGSAPWLWRLRSGIRP
ncbi:MAG: MFS transporter [Acidobacteriota bacterium]